MSALAGRRILIVEDEAVVAVMLEDMLVELGATVVGPAMSVKASLVLAADEAIDAAVLDVNLNGERIDPVAALLRSRGVPIVFATGYGAGSGLGHIAAAVIDKPYTAELLAAALTRALAGPKVDG